MLDYDYDIGCVTSSGTFGMVRMDSPSIDGSQGTFDIPAFIQGVSMNIQLPNQFTFPLRRDMVSHLYIILIRYLQSRINSSRRSSPILMYLQTHCTRLDNISHSIRTTIIPFPRKSKIERDPVCSGKHGLHVEFGRSAGRGC